jgi:L-ascorbate metabolism protein UlaG (beta-lactamase superfamily)
MIIWILIPFISIIFLILIIGLVLSEPGYNGQENDHFDGKRFYNLNGVRAKSFFDVVRWAANRNQGPWREIKDQPFDQVKISQLNDGLPKIWFVNHSTFLIQIGAINILIDPVWSKRVSPFSMMGPRRMRPPGMKYENLPEIDIILISHNHYDHLDLSTLKKLREDYNPRIVVPLGVGQLLQKHGMRNWEELDWWESTRVKDIFRITATPAQHFSGRGMFDRDSTLWCGFHITTGTHSIYYTGDSGYGDFFKKIGDQLKTIDCAIIPIGAFKPQWFMGPVHCTPEEAVRIHLDIGAQASIACHFGTFPLGDDGMEEPVKLLKEARQKYEVHEDKFLILKEGECLLLS